MEKTVQTSAQHVESGSQTRDGLQPAADDGGNDPPPIPNASSTGKGNVLLNEKPVGARSQNNNNIHVQKHEVNTSAGHQSVANVPDWAHTASFDHVAQILGTNVQYVSLLR